MAIGSGIFLFVVGAIIFFAMNFTTFLVNLDLIGYLLMGSGALVFAIALASEFRDRFTSFISRISVDPHCGEKIVRNEIPSPQSKTTSSYRY